MKSVVTFRPITPDEVVAAKGQTIPDDVFGVFNDLIALAWNGRESVVLQEQAVARITTKLGKCDRRWLDIEPIYRNVGWTVEYEKPAYNESTFPARFVFSRKKVTE